MAGRYHLYVAYACPWANRCLAMRALKGAIIFFDHLTYSGLESVIGVSVVHPTWQRTRPNDPDDSHRGWVFATGALTPPSGHGSIDVPGVTGDTINGVESVRDLYDMSNDTNGKYTVPILWDTITKQIVNNESSDILRMFNAEFNEFASGPLATHDFYQHDLQGTIDELNDWIYNSINDGVYRCGFSKSQLAYNEAMSSLIDGLDRVEEILSKQRYLAGNMLTEADIRLFMTLVRFDEVYIVYFKCHYKRITDYPNMHQYCREMYQLPNMASVINMEHIKAHYYTYDDFCT